jgi:hypothetical protein
MKIARVTRALQRSFPKLSRDFPRQNIVKLIDFACKHMQQRAFCHYIFSSVKALLV